MVQMFRIYQPFALKLACPNFQPSFTYAPKRPLWEITLSECILDCVIKHIFIIKDLNFQRWDNCNFWTNFYMIYRNIKYFEKYSFVKICLEIFFFWSEIRDLILQYFIFKKKKKYKIFFKEDFIKIKLLDKLC